MYNIKLIAAFFCCLLPGLLVADDTITVATAAGELRGVRDGDIAVFRGVRFAAPPVAERRWRAPAPVESWEGVRDADVFGPNCPQAPPPTYRDTLLGPQGEDCLFLNVWTGATDDARRPVLVWFHGGAHRFGSGAQIYFDGARLATRDVVVVTVNYRLGLLGYFSHPTIDSEDGGNFGLLDQLAALHWVQENIAAFGGDPGNVTVFGESAGAVDILYHLANPRAAGLFHRAIVQSGGGWGEARSLSDKRAIVDTALTHLELADADADTLRAVPADDWVSVLPQAYRGLGFGPFVDGITVHQSAWRTFREQQTLPVPLLIGVNDWEGSLLPAAALSPQQLAVAHLPAMQALYAEEARDADHRGQLLFGDFGFVAPARWLAGQHAQVAPSYYYYFAYVAQQQRDTLPGVAHGLEIPYVFDFLDSGENLRRIATEADRAMARQVADCWVAFARLGRPECALGEWNAYDSERDNVFVIGPQSGERPGYRAAILDPITRQFAPQ